MRGGEGWAGVYGAQACVKVRMHQVMCAFVHVVCAPVNCTCVCVCDREKERGRTVYWLVVFGAGPDQSSSKR